MRTFSANMSFLGNCIDMPSSLKMCTFTEVHEEEEKMILNLNGREIKE